MLDYLLFIFWSETFIVIFKIFSILVDGDGVAVSGLTSLGELDDESLKLCDKTRNKYH